MDVRADLTKLVYLTPDDWDWSQSPQEGVSRVMLDRVGDEVAIATSFVRFVENGQFPAHDHELGEEFIVLEGEFADENGRYPAGSYLRHPPGSRHKPFSDPGCLIWVKLRQFDRKDQTKVVAILDSSIPKQGWQARELHRFSGERAGEYGANSAEEIVREIVAAAGEQIVLSEDSEIQEVVVLTGEVVFELPGQAAVTLPERSWLRLPQGSGAILSSTRPARLFTKTRPLYNAG